MKNFTLQVLIQNILAGKEVFAPWNKYISKYYLVNIVRQIQFSFHICERKLTRYYCNNHKLALKHKYLDQKLRNKNPINFFF